MVEEVKVIQQTVNDIVAKIAELREQIREAEYKAFKTGYYASLRFHILDQKQYEINVVYPEKSMRVLFNTWKVKGDDFWPKEDE